MDRVLNAPLLLFLCSLVALWICSRLGNLISARLRPLREDERKDFEVVSAATLTLLGLIIGFSFSMAISRYDQRKNYEEAEANAIGTEYVRADLLPSSEAGKVRELLKSYLNQRVLFYESRDRGQLAHINADTARLQDQMWSTVQAAANAKPSPIIALTVAGMNDVLNSQGYTQAAWWNRIPMAAWGLMLAIAMLCNLLVGYGSKRSDRLVLSVLPLALSISFFLIADIDSPRGGVIHVMPQNLVSLSESLHAQ
ncbi:MAG TPA: hypothetical protein VEG30_12725 [Terriglobales bacterium]|nr:hypothetical protein [Terriglobales bacterium]